MIVDQIENNFLNYRFPEEEGFAYGFNLYALVSDTDVIIIDAGFRTQAKMVYNDILLRGLKLTHVLMTHFHPDHVNGLVALPEDITVLGSPEYHRTLRKKIPQTVTPLSFSDGFRFGDFSLSFTPAPGHSPCSILIDINGRYLHAGDNLMSRYDGKAILPWVEYNELANHISSLEMLKAMHRDRVLLGHGPALLNSMEINQAVDDRLSYLKTVLSSSGKCTWEEAIHGCSCEFAGKEFFHQLTGRIID